LAFIREPNVRIKHQVNLTIMSTGLVFSLACSNKSSNPDDLSNNKPPEIISLIAQPDTIGAGGTTSIVVNAVDPENDPLFYGWIASLGSIAGTGSAATWTAPDGSGEYIISVFVEDDRYAAANATITIHVDGSNSDNRPPVISYINASPDVLPSEGQTRITVGAYDPDGDDSLMIYQWGSATGSFSGQGSVVDWTAPRPSCCPTEYSVWVIIRDSEETTSSISTSVTVIP